VLDPDTIANAIWGQESGRGANTKTSVTGATGQMQIQPDTFRQYALPGERIDNPADNLAVGHRIIQDLYNKSHGDPARVAVGYFSGPGNIAPLDSPTPYIHNYHDPNGKYTADYANDVMRRLSGPHPAPGTTLTSVPGAATPIASAPTPTLGQNIQKGDVGAALAQLTSKGSEGQTSPLDKLSGLFKPTAPSEARSESAPMLPQDQTPLITPAAQQLMASTFAASAKPLSWSTLPYGYGLAGPIVPGTTLNGVPQNVYG
jgi:hypothetical protein